MSTGRRGVTTLRLPFPRTEEQHIELRDGGWRPNKGSKKNACTLLSYRIRWWEDGNHSVRDLFSAISSVHYNNPSASFYDMFSDKGSLGAVLNVRAQDARTEVIYLATHGDETRLSAMADTTISRAELRNQIATANALKQIHGLYLGTCLTGNLNTAKFILSGGTNLSWLAGYKKTVDWIDGSAIDMIFFHKLASEYTENKSRKKGKLSPDTLAHRAATKTLMLVPGAHHEYGFNVFFKHSDGSVRSVYDS